MHPPETKIEAGRLAAQGIAKNEIAKRLDVARSQVFQWFADRDPLVMAASADALKVNKAMNSAMREAASGAPIDGDLDGAVTSRAAADGTVEAVDDDRVAAAQEAGLDLRLADRLVGSTREELLADARALAEAIPNRAPVPGLGINGQPISAAPSMNDLIRQAAGLVVTSR
jgi:Helix-turn-helix domain of resolvase